MTPIGHPPTENDLEEFTEGYTQSCGADAMYGVGDTVEANWLQSSCSWIYAWDQDLALHLFEIPYTQDIIPLKE